MKKLITTESGFTLIELMIVVAIIGILSVVAIPTFDGYQKKAKGTEAKISLSHVFTGEKSFESEYGVFCENLKDIGAQNANQKYYSVGFAVGSNVTNCKGATDTVNEPTSPPSGTAKGVADFNAGCITTAAVAATGGVAAIPSKFIACAYAADTGAVDQDWSITHEKVLGATP